MARRCYRLVAVTLTLLLTVTTTGIAQESTGNQSASYRQVVSANPFGWILLPWYNAEYERRVAERITVALSGSEIDWGDGGGFYSVNAAFRYYPSGTPFRGFYLGPRIGVFWESPGLDDAELPRYDADAGFGPHLGLGLEMGYAWLLGAERHLSISVGGGATRIFNSTPIPVIRLINVGWAF